MSESTVALAVLVTGEGVNDDVDLKAKAVSAKLDAFARLLDPFAEGSKFTPINEPGAVEEDSNATESENGAIAEGTSGDDMKDGAVAMEPDSKVVAEDSKTDTPATATTIKKPSAAAKVDEEAPVVKKPTEAQSKKTTADDKAIDDATNAKADAGAPVAKKKRATPKSKKATTDNEDVDEAANVDVDGEAPVVKKKRGPTKAKKATTDNKDIDDAAGAKVDEAAPAAKKKRAATKAKSKKVTTDNEDNGDATEANLPITPPVTPPKKRGRKASTADNADVNGSTPKPKASKKAKITESSEESAEVTTSQESLSTTKTGAARKRAAVTKEKVVARGLPMSMKECSEADRMLLHMKDVDGKPWADIRATWKAMTGQETAASTLPNRYNRLKVNLMALEEGDAPRLLTAKGIIDAEYADYLAKFAAEKWAKVQKAMEALGTTNKYPSGFLAKEFVKLEAAGAAEEKEDGEDKDGDGKDVEMVDGEGSAVEVQEGVEGGE